MMVVKPAVSAASFGTRRFGPQDWADGEAFLAASVGERDMLVQPYVPSVEDYGERALMWVDGGWTHAVRKTPRFGGDAESVSGAVPMAADEQALAERARTVAAALTGSPLLYARADIVRDGEGQPMVAELELIEPSLYLQQGPEALDRLVAGIETRLDGF
jgi:hypothetical protein